MMAADNITEQIRKLVLQKPTSVEEMQHFVTNVLTLLRLTLGPRSSAILTVGIPIEGEHDRFAANYFGPCLTARGLLTWGHRQVEQLIDAGDTSRNGKPHP